MRCVDDTYEQWRRIGNARFDLFPAQICRCSSIQDVKDALAMAKERKLPVRVRAGGHHHEGMCSGNGVLMIDLTPMDWARVDQNNQSAEFGPGTRNGRIYEELWNAHPHQIFAGGGCGDVRVGGFVQGGGWGPYSRALGMACDRITRFHIVLADGSDFDVTPGSAEHHKLFWAVCGGGGGNFGVVTSYRFQTAWIETPLSQFTVSWDDKSLRKRVINDWRNHFPHHTFNGLTSFCRVTADSPDNIDAPVVVAGNCMLSEDDTRALLKTMLPDTWKENPHVDVSPVHKAKDAFAHPEYQPGPPPAALRALPGFDPKDLKDTCAGKPYPHKVSSCFPSSRFNDSAVDAIVSFIEQSAPEKNARRYLSLHSMGGAINTDSPDKPVSCFAWRDKPFMLQYQAWWGDKNDCNITARCLKWVADFRDRMASLPNPYTEGAFINFPDRDLPAKDRQELLLHYYRDMKTLGDLMAVKKQYDPGNLFDFEMGIPPG